MANIPPPKYKLAFLTWLAIYSLITVILYFGCSVLGPLPIYARTLVLTLVLVPLMTWVMLPMLRKLFRRWLEK